MVFFFNHYLTYAFTSLISRNSFSASTHWSAEIKTRASSVGPLTPCGLLRHVTGFCRKINSAVCVSQSRLGDRCRFTPVSKVNFCSFPLAHVSTSVPVLQDLTCCRGPSHWESRRGTLCLLNKERRKLRNATTQWCCKNRNAYTIKYGTEKKVCGRRGLELIALLNISVIMFTYTLSLGYIPTGLF